MLTELKKKNKASINQIILSWYKGAGSDSLSWFAQRSLWKGEYFTNRKAKYLGYLTTSYMPFWRASR